MSDEQETDRQADDGQATGPTPDETKPGEESERPQSREARYRIRAKQAEEERDGLRAALTATRRSILAAAPTGLDPKAAADLFAALDADKVDALFDADTGAVDTGSLERFVRDNVTKAPYLADRRPKPPTLRDIDHQPEDRQPNTWQNAF